MLSNSCSCKSKGWLKLLIILYRRCIVFLVWSTSYFIALQKFLLLMKLAPRYLKYLQIEISFSPKVQWNLSSFPVPNKEFWVCQSLYLRSPFTPCATFYPNNRFSLNTEFYFFHFIVNVIKQQKAEVTIWYQISGALKTPTLRHFSSKMI